MTDLETLSKIKHPYYCSSSNYFSNDYSITLETVTEFLDYMEGSDIDMNLIFRWDVERNIDNDTGELVDGYHAEVFIIQQRKGLFVAYYIKSITEDEVEPFMEYLKKHWQRLNEMWSPIS